MTSSTKKAAYAFDEEIRKQIYEHTLAAYFAELDTTKCIVEMSKLKKAATTGNTVARLRCRMLLKRIDMSKKTIKTHQDAIDKISEIKAKNDQARANITVHDITHSFKASNIKSDEAAIQGGVLMEEAAAISMNVDTFTDRVSQPLDHRETRSDEDLERELDEFLSATDDDMANSLDQDMSIIPPAVPIKQPANPLLHVLPIPRFNRVPVPTRT